MDDLFSKTDYSLYSNAMTYMRRPLVADPTQHDADVVVLGIPFDMATSGRAGARHGPDAIRRASVNLAWETHKFPWNFDLFEHTKVIDAGDLVFDTGDAKDLTVRLEAAADAILSSKKTLLSFGGDHYVTLPLLRAHAKHFGEMALIHFDAHTDTYKHGSCYDHGAMFFHAPNEGLISPKHSVQIGIRTDYSKHDHQFHVIDAMHANDMSVSELIRKIKKIVAKKPVYITFDIDCLDPAFAPGTGTPVCGGMNSDKILKLIRAMHGINIVGMDVVEVSPAYDQSEITALAGATIGLEMLHVWTANKINASE
ncbi:agmatinase [Thalassotalea aquiviva]|uniref:agmatinase n=1 Tax=Thalassotalea aquiviva TaxID=3242415 RepID=UPI00352A200A